jgi:hypothetical protein
MDDRELVKEIIFGALFFGAICAGVIAVFSL